MKATPKFDSPRMAKLRSLLPEHKIAEFCRRWKVSELSLFGSALRDEFRPDSDLDILIAFTSDANWSLLDHIRMQQELETLLHRRVDLISKRALDRSQNPIRKREILKTAQPFFTDHETAHAAG